MVREAAYSLQLPGDRAALHALAFHLIEQAFGGRAPEPPALDAVDPPKLVPHTTDPVAEELASHATLALDAARNPDLGLQSARILYLRRAAEYAQQQYRIGATVTAWEQLAALLEGVQRGEALRRAADTLRMIGEVRRAEPLYQQALSIHS